MNSAEGLLRALPPERASQFSTQILIGDMRAREHQWEQAILHYEAALAAGLCRLTRALPTLKHIAEKSVRETVETEGVKEARYQYV
ncbi:MAG: hypothetical protein HC812_20020 [Leptolyngbya sp. RL_3_1]|nr:hypothetical protein [Leptolyngbya sp. RL_3_1]